MTGFGTNLLGMGSFANRGGLWEETPTFQNFTGSTSNQSGTYTPTTGTTSFLVMMWGSAGHGGNTGNYSNLPAIGAASAGGMGYSERLYTHSAANYSYTLGAKATYNPTGGAGTSPTRTYAGTTYFYGPSHTMSISGTGNPSSSGGSASGGSFNANGGTASSNSSGGGSGSRTGAGNGNGSNGGTSVDSGAVVIDFKGWRGFDWSSSWGQSGSYGSSGRGKYHVRADDVTGGQPLTTIESQWASANPYASAGAVSYNTYGSGSFNSQILILEFH